METIFENTTTAVPHPSKSDKVYKGRGRSASTAELLTDDVVIEEAVVPPDGGYGYVILFAAFISSTVVDGVTYSFGILKDSIIQANSKNSTTIDQATLAWVGSVLAGVYLFTGPLVSAMANRFGFRVVSVFGSVISSIAFILSWYLNRNGLNLEALIIVYGVIGGIGFSCVYVPSVVAVGFYFKKKRALATGVAVCGSGVGNFIFPPLIQILTERYHWQGAILGLGFIVLICAFMGMLYKPFKPESVPSSQEQIEELRGQHGFGNTTYFEDRPTTDTICIPGSSTSKHMLSQHSASNFIIIPLQNATEFSNSSALTSQITAISHIISAVNIPKGKDNFNTVVDVKGEESRCVNSGRSRTISPAGTNCVIWISSAQSTCANLSRSLVNQDEIANDTLSNQPYVKKFFSASRICKLASNMLDFTLWKSPTFIVFCIGSMFMLLGTLVPFVYLTDQARYALKANEAVYDTHSLTLLISIIGAANIVGRIASGWMADRSCISALAINNFAVTMMGVSTMVLPFLRQYYQLAVYSCVFGLSMACCASLRSVLLAELLGLDRLTDAYGFVLLFEGVASTISTPLAGGIVHLYGDEDDFSVAFYLAGGFMLVSACLFFQIDRAQRWEKN